ncbi:MAG: cytosine permease [Butyricicoccaceae bacterium]
MICSRAKAFGSKGSYLPSAMISFTQIGWFGVGIAMFAIPVANELLGGSTAAEWALVIIAGACMTASAYFGIKSLTLISYIAVPLVAILGTIAMVMAVSRGDGTIIDQFAKSSGTLTVIGGAGLVIGSFVSGGTATPNFSRFARNGRIGAITTGHRLFHRQLADVLLRRDLLGLRRRQRHFRGHDQPRSVLSGYSGARPQYLDDQRQRRSTRPVSVSRTLFGRRKPMVLISGIVGTALAVWLYLSELLRLAEYSELHAAPGRHHPRHELLHGPREVPGRRSRRDGQLVCGRRRHPGRRGCKCCVLGHRLHQRHDRSRCLLPDRPRPEKQIISYSG